MRMLMFNRYLVKRLHKVLVIHIHFISSLVLEIRVGGNYYYYSSCSPPESIYLIDIFVQ